ncbi:hypothetical protein [Nodularia spumigena]|uniref:hypothetical protein n=1 Tax=Nodularia spumigena TaxID=70799 RepID=UPI002B20C195|nr:hypothetical protein [Nodularia spumigena]MEA5557299.1 hypothetical protein [Nodularia spumigena CH309]
MTQSKDGNGHGEYSPSKEYEHVTDDVWYEKDTETGERIDVKYTDDILDQMDEDENEDDKSSDD